MNFSLYVTPVESDVNNIEKYLCLQKKIIKKTTSKIRIYLSSTVDTLKIKELKDGRLMMGEFKSKAAKEQTYDFIEAETYEQINDLFWAVIIDTSKDVVKVINDRFSSKEIYHFEDGDAVFVFTDFKILFSLYKGAAKINLSALKAYLIDGYIPAPYTIIDGVSKLPYASCAIIGSKCFQIQRYFLYSELKNAHISNVWVDYIEVKTQFKNVVRKSFAQKKLSDKAIVLLSSGVDSTYLATVAKEIYDGVDALTIGQNVGDDRYDESKAAKKVAEMIGLEQTIKMLDSDLIFDIVEQSLDIFPELFGDTAQVTVYLMAGNGDRFVDYICGEGADSIFYKSGNNGEKYNKKEQLVNKIFNISFHNEKQTQDPFNELLYEWEHVIQGLVHKTVAVFDYFDLNVSFPYLDNSLIRLCASLPELYIGNDVKKKRILRDLLNEKINYDKLCLPKRGAGVPIYKILKEKHKDELIYLLGEKVIARQGIFNVEIITEMLDCFFNDRRLCDVKVSGMIWRLYLFQKWYERYMN